MFAKRRKCLILKEGKTVCKNNTNKNHLTFKLNGSEVALI